MKRIFLALILSSLLGLLFCVPGAALAQWQDVGALNVGALSGKLVKVGTDIYLVKTGVGVSRISVANPASPTEIGSYSCNAQGVAVDATRGKMYVACMTAVHVVNLATMQQESIQSASSSKVKDIVFDLADSVYFICKNGAYLCKMNLSTYAIQEYYLLAIEFTDLDLCGENVCLTYGSSGDNFFILSSNLTLLQKYQLSLASSSHLRCSTSHCYTMVSGTSSYAGIHRIDLTTGGMIFKTITNGLGLGISNDKVFLGRSTGISVFTDDLESVETIDVPDARESVMDADLLFVAAGTNGLRIVRDTTYVPPEEPPATDDIYINPIPALTLNQTPFDLLTTYSSSITTTSANSGLMIIVVFFLYLSFRFVYWATHR